MTIKTNHQKREFIYGFQLSEKQRTKWEKEYDWMNDFEDQMFVWYKGWLHPMEDFAITHDPELIKLGYNGFHSDTFFSGTAIKISDDGETYQIAYCYA